MTKRTSARVRGREIARQRKAAITAQDREREQMVESHMADFETSRLEREEALTAVRTAELAMSKALGGLLGLGETSDRVRVLVGLAAAENTQEFNRLRKLEVSTRKAMPADE